LKITKCKLNDVRTLKELSETTYRQTFGQDNTEDNMMAYLKEAYNEAQLTQELADPNSSFYFAYYQGKLAGYLKLNIFDAQSEEMPTDYLEVERIYFKQDFQHLGLGTQLLNFAIDQANILKKSNIWLGVWEYNYSAQKFYQKLGFERFSEHKFIMGDSVQTDFLLKKGLR